MTPFFNDDGTEINPNLLPIPDLCQVCKKKDDQNEEIICTLSRIGQEPGVEFECYAFENINEERKTNS